MIMNFIVPSHLDLTAFAVVWPCRPLNTTKAPRTIQRDQTTYIAIKYFHKCASMVLNVGFYTYGFKVGEPVLLCDEQHHLEEDLGPLDKAHVTVLHSQTP